MRDSYACGTRLADTSSATYLRAGTTQTFGGVPKVNTSARYTSDFWGCAKGEHYYTHADALPRLLRGDVLRELAMWGHDRLTFDARAAALLAEALRSNCTLTSLILVCSLQASLCLSPQRSNCTLTSLELCNVAVWEDADAAAALLGALVGHTSMKRIRLSGSDRRDDLAAFVGPLLGALVAANSPRLRVLQWS